jgi:hypothetical protein
MREFIAHVRVCARPGCGLPIEEDRARHAKYCRLHGHADAAKSRRVYRGGELIVAQWRAAHRELVRQRTRNYVQQFRARKRIEQEQQQKERRG